MASLNIPFTFTNGTTASAIEVNNNMQAIKNYAESQLVQIDGSVKAGTNSISDGAITAPKIDAAFLNSIMPVGSITQFAGASAPTGWLICEGQTVSRSVYSALFSVVGTTYGAGDGSTTFVLPNLKGRIPVGRDSAQTEFDVLGETGGAKTHTLTSAQIPNHNHTGTVDPSGSHAHTALDAGAHSHSIVVKERESGTHGHGLVNNVSAGSPGTDYINSASIQSGGTHSHATDTQGNHQHTFTTSSVGGGQAHNNLQPYIVVNYIIKAQ
jgi:microcystin-dependent protein